MSLRFKRLLPYAFLAAVMLCALFLRLLTPGSPLQDFLKDKTLYSDELLPEAEEALRFLTTEMHDPTAWDINRGPQRGALAVILFSGGKARSFSRYIDFTRTIAWIAEYQTIIVDVDYLKELALALNLVEQHEDDNPYEKSQHDAEIYKLFLVWVLGHELGHAYHHDPTRHFAPNALDAPTSTATGNQDLENQADEFAAARISASSQYVVGLSNMLLGMLNNELQARMPKTNVQGPAIFLFGRDAIEVLATGSHPEFLVRAARILARLRYPAGTNPEFGVWASRLLGRITAAQANLCSIAIRTTPVAANVILEQNRDHPITYWTPAKLLLSPGHYKLTVVADGYQSSVQEIQFQDCHHAPRLELTLNKDYTTVPSRQSPETEFAEMRDAAYRRVDHGKFLQQQHQWKAAEWELAQAVNTDTGWSEPLFLQALLKSHYGAVKDARDLWNRAIDLRQHESAAYELDNYTLLQLVNKKAEADKILSEHPRDTKSLRSLGEVWLELGETQKAEPLIKMLLKGPSSTCQDRWNMGQLLIALHEKEEAISFLRAQTLCAGLEGERSLLLADAFEADGRINLARKYFLRAYRKDESNWESLVQFFRRRKQYSLAFHVAYARARRHPDDTDTLNAVAQVELDCGRIQRAQRWFHKALTTYMNNVDATVGLARVAGERRDWQEASALCRQATAGNNWDSREAWSCLGDAERQQGNNQDALVAYENAVWLSPLEPQSHIDLAAIYQELGDTERAELHRSFATSLRSRLPSSQIGELLY